MPCLEEADLSSTAELHIKAQKSVVANLKTRVSELEHERKRLLSEGAIEETSQPLKETEKAIKHLRLELYGEVESPPGSMQFVRDPAKKTAEERSAVMEMLYRNRTHYQFHDTSKDLSDPRTASVFGLPTIKEMIERGYGDIAEEMMIRATSLLAAKADSRNPVDFLDTEGLEVKLALANQIEHHHIYNNVKVDENGRVQFKSYRVALGKGGELEMSVIPSYWNAAENGRNTQFICLMDAMHSGDDPIAHMHYYRFSEDEAAPIKDKIKRDVAAKAEEAQKTAVRLQTKLDDLVARKTDPAAYEKALQTQLDNTQSELARIEAQNAPFKGKRNLTDEQRQQKDDLAAQKKVWDSEGRAIARKLDEHRSLQGLRDGIISTENAIADLEARVKGINLSKVPKEEKEAKRLEKEQLTKESRQLKEKLREQKILLKSKGDIDKTIEGTRKSLLEAQLVSRLDKESAIALFEKSNGFFSFDKGTEEKNDHTTYRPIMNEEITRFYVREAIAYMQEKHGDRWLEELQALTARQYRSNLLQRLGGLMDKLDPSRSDRNFFDGGWGGSEA